MTPTTSASRAGVGAGSTGGNEADPGHRSEPSANDLGTAAASPARPASAVPTTDDGSSSSPRARARSPARASPKKQVILFLAANPAATARLALDREARSIRAELKRSGYRDRFAYETRWAAEPLDLLRELRELRPTVVHFSGHGGARGSGPAGAARGRDLCVEPMQSDDAPDGLYFHDAAGGARAVSPGAIAQTFRAAGSSVKLVVLNACFTEPVAEALLAYVDCVVGVPGSIHDDAARSFAIGFYGGLGEHESIAAAFEQGRAAINLEGFPDAERPELKVREGFDATELILAATVPAVHQVPTYPYAADNAPRFHGRDAEFAIAWCSLAIEDLECRPLHCPAEFEGLIVGNYQLGKPLGYGGTGVVFRAHHRSLMNEVALKLFYPVSGARRELLGAVERSARGLKSLQHRGIVELLDLGHLEVEDTDAVYVVMELVEGESLNHWSHRLGHGSGATHARIAVAIEIASALQAAHTSSYLDNLGFAQTGVLHGDVKPANILVRQRDAQPVLLDFMMPDLQRLIAVAPGLAASIRERARSASLTAEFGTHGYMPPEQADEGIVLPASDVYSLGRTLCEIFSEILNETFIDTIADGGTELTNPTPAALDWTHAGELGDLLSSMIRPKPSDRPTMAAVVDRLRALRDLPVVP